MKSLSLVFTLMIIAPPSCSADAAQGAPSGLRLRSEPVIEAAPQRGQRFSVRARFAPVPSAGELREGPNFTLIGRLAKGAASCDFSAVFSDGFEGN